VLGTWIAPGEALLGGVERGAERVARADFAEPCLGFDGLLERATADGTTTSEVIRQALRRFLEAA